MPPTSGRRLRSATVAATMTLSLASALTGCGGGSKKAEWAEICVHRQKQVRASDTECVADRTGAHAWYYIPRKNGNSVPAMSGSISLVKGGTYDRPRKGSITRGGFGTIKQDSSGSGGGGVTGG
jgi:hypothetical protein